MLTEVREQPEGVRFLRRVVDRQLKNPLLLLGDEGVGRKFSAIQATKELFCVGGKEPGCRCFHCVQIEQGIHPDFMVVLPDNGEVKVGPIRDLISFSHSYPSIAPVKVFIIDGADKMNAASSNSLLKTIEEPPSSAVFFLLAESINRVIPTIRSRCGTVRYNPLSESFIVSVLQRADCEKAQVIARMSEGSVGRAVQYMGAGRLALRDKVLGLLQLALANNLPSVFSSVDGLEKDMPLVLRFLEQLVHDVILFRGSSPLVIHLDQLEALGVLAEKKSIESWHGFLTAVHDLRERTRTRINLPFHVKNLFAQAFWVN